MMCRTERLHIGKRFVVFPFFEGDPRSDDPARLPIFIGRGRAFGSGLHETTAAVLEEMETIPDWTASTVLDIGCGTGILSIAAARLGARSVTAVDTEEDAVAAACRNVRLNGVHDRVRVLRGDIRSAAGERYGIVLANLYGDLLAGIAADVASLTELTGRLILSGIGYQDAYDVEAAYARHGIALERSRALDDYWVFVMKKTLEAHR
jgi:ribosomal protein L11 methyltransferase